MAEHHETAESGASQSGASTDVDRRSTDRLPTASPARVRSPFVELVGTVRDCSRGGLFLEIDGDLVFEVEYEEEGQIVQRSARLLRSQRLPGGHSGWAVEFLERT